ncbi:MAG: UDP-N-acetylmuramate dehydrogenase [Acidimicrobiales bacterium]
MTAEPSLERAAELLAGRAERHAPLGALTTYRVGGPAALLLRVDDEDDLRALAEVVVATGVDVLVVGNGSNLLVADAGFAGLAVVLGERYAQVHIDHSDVVAGAGALLPVVARRSVTAGLTGFEWAVGVPGSIGGAVRMNAGGHGSDMAASLAGVRVMDLRSGEDGWVPATALQLGYRSSSVTSHQLVVEARLSLRPGDVARSTAEVSEIVAWRRAHQPGGPNAGSVFTNPPDDSAGRLIEAAGGKGRRHGTASVSSKHANFIQADVGGRADDIRALMTEVQSLVQVSAGVALEPETRLVGFPDDPRPEVEGSA